jgi:phosphoribosylanthranilate isomerase
MTRIKICGITNKEDYAAAIAYGADALGFIGVAESPRYVTPAQFDEITAAPGPFVPRVIVVNKPEDANKYAADYVQYYEEGEIAQYRTTIRSFRMRATESLDELRRFTQPVGALLLDSYHGHALGGVGETFNWELAVEAKKLTTVPIILAGGLTADNVQGALAVVRPYAVDVSTGVELRRGVKDHIRLRAFIRAVRKWDAKYDH